MIKEKVSVDDVIDFLNEVLSLDHSVAQAILDNRVPCNFAVANHNSIQVRCEDVDVNCSVGLLGLLNGVFGANEKGYGPIAAVVEKDGKVSSFRRLVEKE